MKASVPDVVVDRVRASFPGERWFNRGVDENFVAKLLDVGTELRFPAGAVVSSPDAPLTGMLLVMQGELTVDGDPRGAGHVIGRWELLEEVTVKAETDARVIAVDRADFEAAATG